MKQVAATKCLVSISSDAAALEDVLRFPTLHSFGYRPQKFQSASRSSRRRMASVRMDKVTAQNDPPHIEPEKTYYGAYKEDQPPVQLRIATGGAGRSGLLGALADGFINDHVKETGCKPFAVAWIKSDTAGSFNNLAQGSADLSIAYHPAAEEIASQQGFHRSKRLRMARSFHACRYAPLSPKRNIPISLPKPTSP